MKLRLKQQAHPLRIVSPAKTEPQPQPQLRRKHHQLSTNNQHTMSAALEDTVFSDPGLIEFLNSWYVPRGAPPGITAESVHMYFLNSPFLDPQSNNGQLRGQANSNDFMWDRKSMDAKLDKMAGTEYRVVDGPETSFGIQGPGNPVWVIRKQIRSKKSSEERGDYFRVTRVEGTYFVMGDMIYMAPSLEDVLRIRLVCHSILVPSP